MMLRHFNGKQQLMHKVFVLLIIISGLSACGKKYLYDDVHAIASAGWDRTSKERFIFEVPDSTNNYLFYLHLRHNVDYRYSNLYLFMETQFPNGNITRDTLECIIADPSGKWTGNGNGRLKTNLILLNPSLRFPLKGTYTIDIEQAMRDEVLEGITDVGIRIEQNRR